MKRKHPMQTVVMVGGVIRFTENEIVKHLLDAYPGGLNDIARKFRNHTEDYEQLMMLIGYSLSGFADLSCANPRTVALADIAADEILDEVRSGVISCGGGGAGGVLG